MTDPAPVRRWVSAGALALILVLGAVHPADARRGGSFGSRGMRTYSAPRSTYTAPGYTAPVQRSMTPRAGGYGQPGYGQAGYGYQRPGFGAQRGGFLRRWGGPLLGGLAMGGLFGMMMGHGFGGGGGFLALLIQLAVLFFVVSLVMRLFRRRAQPAFGSAEAPSAFQPSVFGGPQPVGPAAGSFLGGYGAAQPAPTYGGPGGQADELGLTKADFDAFEQMLGRVQSAFGREDYATLRDLTTPEAMSYLSEELSQNAVAGRRNEVGDVRLLQGDLSEAWREGDREYATVAMRYAGVDVMRDRATGRVLEGDPARPTETTELWTFVRGQGGPWKLSAIQDAAGR